MRGLAFILSLVLSYPILAHGGRTNSEGCHSNRKTGDYHCHNGSSVRAPQELITQTASSDSCPIVGNKVSRVYHVPGGTHYTKMLTKNTGHDSRECFSRTQDAEEAGYRKSKN